MNTPTPMKSGTIRASDSLAVKFSDGEPSGEHARNFHRILKEHGYTSVGHSKESGTHEYVHPSGHRAGVGKHSVWHAASGSSSDTIHDTPSSLGKHLSQLHSGGK